MSPSLADRTFTWASSNPPGAEATRHLGESFFRGTIAFFGDLGLSLVTIEKIFFVLVFMGSGLSMYYLVSTLIKGERKRLAALTASFFWMLNPYVMNYLWHPLFLPLEL
ncbi:MAG: hypothetical protein QGI87_06740, partial [Candidatus Bathyarchaeota archaeon]|nr:hypothetical protein [Candidatus Bathyarchaeota archaeon]